MEDKWINYDEMPPDDSGVYLIEVETDFLKPKQSSIVICSQYNHISGYWLDGVDNIIKWKKITGWVEAEIKPPTNFGVLVFIPAEDDHITSGMWDISGKWVLLDEYRTPENEVTHWQLLPAPPQTTQQ